MARTLLFSVTKKDLDITNFCAGGPGGQHQNKVATAARVVHRESGAVGEARDSRSQHANIKAAFVRMTETKEFKLWHKLKAAKLMGQKSIEEIVEEQMNPRHIRVECKPDGRKWEQCELDQLDPNRS